MLAAVRVSSEMATPFPSMTSYKEARKVYRSCISPARSFAPLMMATYVMCIRVVIKACSGNGETRRHRCYDFGNLSRCLRINRGTAHYAFLDLSVVVARLQVSMYDKVMGTGGHSSWNGLIAALTCIVQ